MKYGFKIGIGAFAEGQNIKFPELQRFIGAETDAGTLGAIALTMRNCLRREFGPLFLDLVKVEVQLRDGNVMVYFVSEEAIGHQMIRDLIDMLKEQTGAPDMQIEDVKTVVADDTLTMETIHEAARAMCEEPYAPGYEDAMKITIKNQIVEQIVKAYGECARDVVKVTVAYDTAVTMAIDIQSDGSNLGDAIVDHMNKIRAELEAEDNGTVPEETRSH